MKNIFLLPMLVLVSAFVGCKSKEVKWDATGTFEATDVTVSARGTGNIMVLNVTEGEQLVMGQSLGYIDTLELDMQRHQLMRTREGVSDQGMDIAVQLASLDQQIAWQKSELARFQGLLAANAATQKQVDDITNQIAVLKRQRDAERLRMVDGNSNIDQQVRALDAQIDQITYRISQCAIEAPISGTVLVKYMEQGEFAAAGRPLFAMANLDSVYLRAYITSDLLSGVRLGQSAKVYADYGDKNYREYPGHVTWISGRAEFTPKTIQTNVERAEMVYAIKVAVKNDGYIKMGMYGLVTF